MLVLTLALGLGAEDMVAVLKAYEFLDRESLC